MFDNGEEPDEISFEDGLPDEKGSFNNRNGFPTYKRIMNHNREKLIKP
mgnify:CR=1 FL=1